MESDGTMDLFAQRTESELKSLVRDGLHSREGTECPVCGQTCRVYRRPLNSTMARGLLWLLTEVRSEIHPTRIWVDIRSSAPRWLVAAGGEFAKLRHWGLIEQMPYEGTDKLASGTWRITEKGLRFALKHFKIPKRVYLFNNTIEGWSEDRVDIQEALGTKFNYAELLGEEVYNAVFKTSQF